MTGPIVLLHGFTQTGRSWRGVIDALARLGGRPDLAATAPVLAPDLRGHGAAADARPVALDAVFADLDGWTAPEATLGGYSMGGRLALAYALARPGRLSRLVLVGASPGLASPEERRERRAADEELAASIERDGVEAFAERWARLPLWAGQPEDVARTARAERLGQSPAGLAAALRGLGTGALESRWEALAACTAPVTLVVGERDAKFRAIAAAMAERLPSAELVVVAGAGHAVHLEAPDAVARALAGSGRP